MNFLDILAQALAGGARGGPMSPSTMGPNGTDRQPALPPGIRRPPQIDDAVISGTSGDEAMHDTSAFHTNSGGYTPPSQGSGGLLEKVGQMFTGNSSREGYNRTQMLRWIQEEGNVDSATAMMVASSPEMLQRFALSQMERRQKAGQPDWAVETIYDDSGNERKVRLDKNTGRYEPLGGSKSAILSPEEEQQKIRLAQASRTQINNNMPGQTTENAYDKEIGTTYAKRYTETQQMAANARKGLNTVAVMRQAMKQPGFYSGTASGAVQYGKRLLSSLGFSDADVNGVASMEQFAAMSKQAALDLMGGSLGSGFSNADRDFVTGQVANLTNTPEGNVALLGIQEKVLRRTQEIGKMATDFAKKNGGRIGPAFDDYLAEWSEKNPLFPKTEKTEQPWYRRDDQGPTRIRNPEPQQRWRATNPQTGEAIEWNGNAWVPAQ